MRGVGPRQDLRETSGSDTWEPWDPDRICAVAFLGLPNSGCFWKAYPGSSKTLRRWRRINTSLSIHSNPTPRRTHIAFRTPPLHTFVPSYYIISRPPRPPTSLTAPNARRYEHIVVSLQMDRPPPLTGCLRGGALWSSYHRGRGIHAEAR